MARETVPLSERVAKALACPPDKADRLYFDEGIPGFALRVFSTGRKTWTFQYRSPSDGKDKKVVLGPWPGVSAADARTEALALKAAVARKRCPVTERKDAVAEAEHVKAIEAAALASVVTVGAAIDRYVEGHAKLNLRDWKRSTNKLKAALAPFADRDVRTLERGELVRRLDEIAATSGPTASNRAQAYMRAAFGWWCNRGFVADVPLDRMRKQHREEARERVLTDAELARVWRATDHTTVPRAFGDIVRLLVLTGCRRQEIGSLEWRDLDLVGRVLVIRAENSKSRRQRIVPLTETGLAILEARPRYAAPFVFGDATAGAAPWQGWGKAKEQLDRAAGVTNWTLHDLRRTAATRWDEIGVGIAVIEAILGHVSGTRGGIVGVYNRADYSARARDALDLWDRRLRAITADETACS